MIQYFPIVTGSLVVLGNISVSGSINASGSVTISGSIASASYALSASNAATASSADNFLTRGTLTAQTIVVQTITSSVDFVTGSTRFGSTGSNTHQFTGSVSVTGSFAVVTTGTEFQVGATGVNLGNALTDSHIISGSLTVNPNGLFVSSSNVVGIGTTTPSTKVHIYEPLTNTTSYLTIQNNRARNAAVYTVTTNGGFYAGTSIGTDTFNYQIYDGVAGLARITVDSVGNIGMGTLNPSQYQHGGTNRVLEIQNPSSSANAQSHLILSTGATSNVGSIGSITFALPNTAGADKRAAMVQSLIESNSATTANGSLLFLTSNAGSLDTRMTITAAGRVFINNSSGVSLNGLTNFLSVSSTTYNLFDISRFSDNAFGPNFYLVKSRNGSIGGNTIVASGDNLGNIVWLGANGTGFTDAASIRAEVDGTPGASNDMPGRLVFTTTGDGSGTPTERMRISSNGNVGIGNNISIGTEANLHLGAFSANEGGQLILQRATSYASASHLDNYQNRFRVLSGNDTTSAAERFSVDMTNANVTIYGNTIRAGVKEYAGQVFPPSPYTADLQLSIVHDSWGDNWDSGTAYVEFQARAYGTNQTTSAYGMITYRMNTGGTTISNVVTSGVTTNNVTISTDTATTRTLKITFAVAANVDETSVFVRTTNTRVSSFSVAAV